ncbi:MAG: polyphenol oxidase family protein [Planctomycetota bacterium]
MRRASFELPGPWPGVAHRVTTRAFGNLSLTCGAFGDPLPARRRLAGELGLGLEDLVMTGLVHGRDVARATSGDRGRGARDRDVLAAADAVWTTDPDLWLMVTSADCYPVLVAGPGVVGLAHAGWRGVLAGVVPALVEAIARGAGLAPARLRVGIGPGIGAEHFELGHEECAAFHAAGHGARVSGRRVDLRGVLEDQARAAGVGALASPPLCTWAEPARFYSYRRERGRTGRFGLAARLLPR